MYFRIPLLLPMIVMWTGHQNQVVLGLGTYRILILVFAVWMDQVEIVTVGASWIFCPVLADSLISTIALIPIDIFDSIRTNALRSAVYIAKLIFYQYANNEDLLPCDVASLCERHIAG